jgi:glycosyltransferase involved in cell wall biosynthesis
VDLIKLLKSSTIFCLPSQVEGFGISTIEAAAAGVPYVVSDIDVFREITRNGQGGLLFDTNSISDLASKIQRLLKDHSLYAKKVIEGYKLAARYQWQDVAKATEKVYTSALNS